MSDLLPREADDVLLEGLHAVKHALRFGADVRSMVTDDLPGLLALASELCPDVADEIATQAAVVDRDQFRALTHRPPGSPVLAVARRPLVDLGGVLVRDDAPVIVVHEPRHAGNAGAVVRVAAAGGARAVLVAGSLDVWSPAVVRAAAGLHWAVEVATVPWPVATERPLIAFDPDGHPYDPSALPTGPMMVFGGERHGLPDDVLNQADQVLALPMRDGVSSLNLATSVAAALYAWRLQAR